jgi:hypothetical protein
MGELRSLTGMQQAFVVAFTTTPGCIGKTKEAALAAGYSEATAYDQGRHLVTLPHIKAAIFRANVDQVGGRLATLAIGVIEDIMLDKEASKAVRLDAAKTILDRAGISGVRAPLSVSDIGLKDLNEMSPDELSETIALARGAKLAIEARMRQIGHSGGATLEGQAVEVDGEQSQG